VDRTYNLLRNTNEGMNGYVKDPAHEALDEPDARRYLYHHPFAARELGRRARMNVAGPHDATAAAASFGQRCAASPAGADR